MFNFIQGQIEDPAHKTLYLAKETVLPKLHPGTKNELAFDRCLL